ncbi:aminotransferase class V-fold PLP-dependent enzyme [Allorhodopirellula heiligendammensis]|uniref:cysteine desulfurase n=1 Tax=Allorhodopirellula heiligendammensis TaxID=2714739 RepID=A0A5C6C8F7_9BACT|nr:SufS family cysteine desulfurase [Allorhodopirellula heiligendammensis]TWU19604.1 putative cysteine desulfurase [Allorhodopirellula heiligendammensis]
MSLLDTDQIRQDFPILDRTVTSGEQLVYLDNAASTQRPRAVIEAMDDCYLRYYSNVHRGIHTLSEESTRAYEAARRTTAGFLNASSTQEIIFTAGTTAAINTVARSWGDANVSSTDVILTLISEHHANIVPWHQLAARTGCRVEFIPMDENFEISDTVVAEYLDRFKPKMFAFAAASNTLGSEYPVQRWTSLAHDHGATVLIDAAQAAPHQQIDVQQWAADFLVFSGHKVCGPTGIGVLYGKRELLDAMPAFLGGGGMILNVTTEGFTTHELPEKFEAGTPPIVEAIGLAAALDYLSSIGMDRIHAHERVLGERVDAGLRQIDGVRVIGPSADKKAGINSFLIEGVHAHDVSQFLDGRGVAVRAGHHCTMPLHQAIGVTATTRASCYLYNTPAEVDRLLEAVAGVRAKFAKSGRRRRSRRSVESAP